MFSVSGLAEQAFAVRVVAVWLMLVGKEFGAETRSVSSRWRSSVQYILEYDSVQKQTMPIDSMGIQCY